MGNSQAKRRKISEDKYEKKVKSNIIKSIQLDDIICGIFQIKIEKTLNTTFNDFSDSDELIQMLYQNCYDCYTKMVCGLDLNIFKFNIIYDEYVYISCLKNTTFCSKSIVTQIIKNIDNSNKERIIVDNFKKNKKQITSNLDRCKSILTTLTEDNKSSFTSLNEINEEITVNKELNVLVSIIEDMPSYFKIRDKFTSYISSINNICKKEKLLQIIEFYEMLITESDKTIEKYPKHMNIYEKNTKFFLKMWIDNKRVMDYSPENSS